MFNRPIAIKHYLKGLALPILTLSLFPLTACGTSAWPEASDTAPLSAMQLRPLSLSEEDKQKQSVSLDDTQVTSQSYEYQTDRSMIEIHFFIEEFKDGILTCLAEAGGPAPESGTFAVLFDPDEITLSWEGGDFSHLIDTSPGEIGVGFPSSTQLPDLTPLRYNEKEAVAVLVGSRSGSNENVTAADYHDLLSLKEKNYERVIFVTVAFTDFSVKDGLASYHGTLRDKSDLSSDTIRWLENYNQMDVFYQLCLSYMPPEFMNFTDSDLPVLTIETETSTEPTPEAGAAD